MAQGRRMVVRKADEHHMYKYPAAVFEDFALAQPAHAPRILAASLYRLPDAATTDARVYQRAREALAKLSK
jgi:hypothetical protein